MTNPNTRFVIGLFFGLLIAGPTGYFLAGAKGAKDIGKADLAPQATAPIAAAQTGDLQEVAQPTAREQVKREAARPTKVEVDNAKVDELMGTLTVQKAEQKTGEGVIDGVVLDTNGKPLAGVLIRTRALTRRARGSKPSSRGLGAPEDRPLKEVVRSAAQNHLNRLANQRETRTDASGAYRFEDLFESTWRISAYLKGYAITADGGSSNIPIGSEVNFTAMTLIEVPITVLDPNGQTATRALVEAEGLGETSDGNRVAWTPEEAFMRLTPGRYKMTAYSQSGEGFSNTELASESVELELMDGASPDALTLALHNRLGISGMVKIVKGDLLDSYVPIYLHPLAADQEINLVGLTKSDLIEYVRPGEEFEFLDLEPGRYLIGAARNFDTVVEVHEVVEIFDKAARVDLELPLLDRSKALRAVVLDPSGQALDGVSFNLVMEQDSDEKESYMTPMLEKGGAYVLVLERQFVEGYYGAKSSVSTFTLQVQHDKYGSVEVPLAPGQAEVQIVFDAPASLQVTIGNYQGSGYEGRVRVSAKKGLLKDISPYEFSGDEGGFSSEGVQVLNGWAPGIYTLLLSSKSSDAGSTWFEATRLEARQVELRSGANQVQMDIPILYSLRVRWADGKAGAYLLLTPVDSMEPFDRRVSALDGEGIADFENLRPGRYLLGTTGGKIAKQPIVIPSGAIEFLPVEPNALEVGISDPKGTFAKVGLRSGDLVIGTNGAEFTAGADLNVLNPLFSSKSAQVELMVLRKGAQLRVLLKGTQMGNWSDAGGELRPIVR